TGVMLLWPYVLTKSVTVPNEDTGSLTNDLNSCLVAAVAGQGEALPHVVKRTTQSCDSSYEDYCFNNGQCMLLVDINEHHCNCDRGFYGHRCAEVEFVSQPIGETQIIVIIFCVCLLIIGLAGALYFFCKWYKKNRFASQQKRQGYRGVQLV
uniref:EGF-like domain-containing protein n=1 Tax=Anabas testudineus TaxID=64144 RepID=A0A3Q1JP86_ANATE